ncbi:MAG TPA: hypothetical protein VH040_02020 [Usitatibacter sp.]|nr:hypothetical protein [Usitatibacter sp.]
MDINDVEEAQRAIGSFVVFDRKESFPLLQPGHFVAAASRAGNVFSDEFLDFLDCAAPEDTLTLLVLDPSPSDYFGKHFALYPLIRLSSRKAHEFFRDVHWAPESSADSIASRAERLAIVHPGGDWVMLSDRDTDLLLIYVASQRTCEAISRCLPEELKVPLQDVRNELDAAGVENADLVLGLRTSE